MPEAEVDIPPFVYQYADRHSVTKRYQKRIGGRLEIVEKKQPANVIRIISKPMLKLAADLEDLVFRGKIPCCVARYRLIDAYPQCNAPHYVGESAIRLIKDFPHAKRIIPKPGMGLRKQCEMEGWLLTDES